MGERKVLIFSGTFGDWESRDVFIYRPKGSRGVGFTVGQDRLRYARIPNALLDFTCCPQM
jgi:hypothetical protein